MAVRFHSWSRRRLLASACCAAGAWASDRKGKGEVFETEVERYSDPSTEFQVYRLTDPSYASTLPATYNRIISRNSSTLLYSCDRSGTPQAFRMTLRTGESQQLTDVPDLDPYSLAFLPDGRSFCYFAGRTLYISSMMTLRERPVYTIAEGWERGSGLNLAADGAHATIIERRGENSRLRVLTLGKGTERTLLEAPFVISDPMERPQRAQLLYRKSGGGLWLAGADGKPNRELKLAPGGIGPAYWSENGKSILYLNVPDDRAQLNTIREYFPDQDTDKLVAKTSQYADFDCNRDTSVFVGASRNAASPVILIMLRVTRRELTLCEHRASHPESVAPVFAPDAQRIYFQSDRHGKPAIYSVHLEGWVERIGEDPQ